VLRKIGHIIIVVFAVILILFGGITLVLRNSAVQQRLIHSATIFLSKELQTEVTIGRVDWRLFNHVALEQLYIADRSTDTLLFADQLEVGVRIFPLLRKEVIISNIFLENAVVKLKKNDDGELNFQFLLDAFKKEKKEEESNVRYEIKDVELNNCSVSYDDFRKNHISDKFDVNHLDFQQLNLALELGTLSKNEIDLQLNSFSFVEQSGLKLSDLSFSFVADKTTALLQNLSLRMPQTKFTIDSLRTDHSAVFADSTIRWDSLYADIYLSNSSVFLSDLSPVFPQLSSVDQQVLITTHLSGNLSKISAPYFYLNVGDVVRLRSSIKVAGLPKKEKTFFDINLSECSTQSLLLQDLLSDILSRPMILPKQLDNLGKIMYKGDISGSFSNVVLNGILSTQVGELALDANCLMNDDFSKLNFNSYVETEGVDLGKLLNKENVFGKIALNLNLTGVYGKSKKGADATLDGAISSFGLNGYEYNDIVINGEVSPSSFTGKMAMKDENAILDFDGKIIWDSGFPKGDFHLSVDDFSPYRLNLTKENKDLWLGFDLYFDYLDDKSITRSAEFRLDNLVVKNNDKVFSTYPIVFSSAVRDSIILLKLDSHLAQAELEGRFSLSTLPNSFKALRDHYFPLLKSEQQPEYKADNHIFFSLKNIHIDKLAEVLNQRIFIDSTSYLKGEIDDRHGAFYVEGRIPRFGIKKFRFRDTKIDLSNDDGATLLHFSTKMFGPKSNKPTDLAIMANVVPNFIDWGLTWNNRDFYGQLDFSTRLFKTEENQLMADIAIRPTTFTINGDRWMVNEANIKTDFKRFEVSDFALEGKEQHIRLDGMIGNTFEDSLNVDLRDVRLSYIMNLVNVHQVELDAMLTGKATAYSVLNKMALNIDARGEDFSFNESVWGDVDLVSRWSTIDKKLVAEAKAQRHLSSKPNDYVAVLRGEYYPKNDSLDFYGDADRLNLEFIQKYLNGIMKTVKGDGSGRIRLFGSLKKIFLSGDVMVNNGLLNVAFLNTNFHFNDTIKIRPESFEFENVAVFDDEKHQGEISGKITHDYFKNINYDISAKVNNMLGMNLSSEESQLFYGKAYASGDIFIKGSPQEANFYLFLKSEPKTKIFLPLALSSSVSENSFIKYVSRPDSTLLAREALRRRLRRPRFAQQTAETKKEPEETSTRMKVSLTVEATPDAEVTIITSEEGDMLKATGSGSLRMVYDDKEDLKLFGNYEVENGKYVFTLQHIIRRDFNLRKGGTISWTGNPTQATIDLDAVYPIASVSLTDLFEESELEGLPKKSVPVNCLLDLTGDLMMPTIKFGIEVPSDPEIQRRVSNIVSTDEMMNREILALLVMNRFYRPDYMQQSATSGLGNMASVITTTLSGQLNALLSQFSDKVNVGVNARLGNGIDMSDGGEYDVSVMYQPNSRLVINGNVGYRNDQIGATTTGGGVAPVSASNFVGDIDIEYKLVRSGKLRAKAYNRSADNYYYNVSGLAKMTQGVGLLYREDFNNSKDLMESNFGRLRKKKQQKQQLKDSLQRANDSIKMRKDSLLLNDSVWIKNDSILNQKIQK
jgi:hypothetical protein